MEVVFFATLPSKTMIFKIPGLLFFSVFSNLFHIPFRTSFCDFFTDFRVAKPPVLELVGSISRQQKNESKNGMRVYASVCGFGRGASL